MARKKKPVVRRKKSPTRGRKHVIKKRSRKVSNARSSRVSRKVVKRATRPRVRKSRPAKPLRKVAPRKHAARKRQAPRIDPQRAELLLEKLSGRIARAKSAREVRRLQKELSQLMRERRALGFRTAFGNEAPEPPERPTRPREDYGYADDYEDEDEDDEDFVGPVGDSYDEDFELIDWDTVDWDDVIDEIGDELEDAYSGQDAK